MAEEGGGGWKRLRRSVGQIGPVRLLATILFLAAGLYVARFNADIPLSSDAERALYDWRFTRSATRVLQQDDRIVLVTYNDETLQQLGKRSPLDRHMLALALRAIDAMGARAIGIDILIDPARPARPASRWSPPPMTASSGAGRSSGPACSRFSPMRSPARSIPSSETTRAASTIAFPVPRRPTRSRSSPICRSSS